MREVFTNRGQLLLIALCLAPVVLWAEAAPLDTRFGETSTSLTSIGVICVLMGTCLFAWNLVLGVRLKIIDRLFGGLDKMFRFHRIHGRIAFLLLLAHALLILGARAVSATRFDVPLFFSNEVLTVVIGAIALVLMAVVLGLTLYARLNHEVFLYVHRLFGVSFLLAALHVFRTPGTKSMSAPLTYYLAATSLMGLAAFVYRSLAGEDLVPRYDYRVTSVRRLDQSVTEIAMRPEDQALTYKPGQFVFVTFYSEALEKEFHPVEVTPEGASAVVAIRTGAMGPQAHPFSITTAPGDPELRITVKALGDFTQAVQFLETGALARIEGPFGAFSYLNVPNRKQVWIAGGIGITPFLSMIRNLDSNEYQIDFYYAMEQGDQGYFLEELYEIADRYPRVRVVPIVKGKLGYMTAEDVEGVSPDLSDKDILICGPPGMLNSLVKQFHEKGVPASRIHFEERWTTN